jgi:hypothetical protein
LVSHAETRTHAESVREQGAEGDTSVYVGSLLARSTTSFSAPMGQIYVKRYVQTSFYNAISSVVGQVAWSV